MKKLEEKVIDELFGSCFFDDNEIIKGRPTSNFTSVMSINPTAGITVLLSTNKLNKNKRKIIEFVDLLPKIEEGNSLESLYYNKDGNKWCDNIKILDELIMLAMACGVLTYSTIEIDGEEIAIIKRVRENDKLEVKGVSPEFLPVIKENQLSIGYTAAEKRMIVENKIRITEVLNKYNKIINIGLGFFGISAKINQENENQLDFYDKEGKLLFNRKFEDTTGIVGWEAIFNQRLSCEFNDQDGDKINYLVDRNRHIFMLSAYQEKKYGYRVEITTDDNTENYSRLTIVVTDANADCIIKKLEIDEKDLMVEVNNHFGSYGNGGPMRLLWYRDTIASHDPLLFMTEEDGDYVGHNLIGDERGIRVDGNKFVDYLSRREFYNLATNIALHPRNRELILYTVEAIDEALHGVKNFITENFSLYRFLTEETYQPNPATDAIVEATIYDKCNFTQQSKVLEKKADEN